MFCKVYSSAANTTSNGYVSWRTNGSGGVRQRDRRGYENNSVAIVIFIIRWRRLACTIVRRRSRHRRFSDSYGFFIFILLLLLLSLRNSNTLYLCKRDYRHRHSIFPSGRAYELQYYIINIYICTCAVTAPRQLGLGAWARRSKTLVFFFFYCYSSNHLSRVWYTLMNSKL